MGSLFCQSTADYIINWSIVTAIGSIVIGGLSTSAAIFASWNAYRIMRRQTANTFKIAWIQAFRTECVNYLSICDKIVDPAEVVTQQEYNKAIYGLRFFLSRKKQSDIAMIDINREFSSFLSTFNTSNDPVIKEQWQNEYDIYTKRVIDCIEDVIMEAEKSI